MTRLGDKAVQDHDHVYVHDHDHEHVVVNVGVDVIVNVAGFQNPRFRTPFPNDLQTLCLSGNCKNDEQNSTFLTTNSITHERLTERSQKSKEPNSAI